MAGQEQHHCEYPSQVKIDDDIKKHISRYYIAVDTIGKDEDYAQCFSEDALLTMPNGSEVRGRDALRALHQNMWGGVNRRLHLPLKAFVYGNDGTELFILGSVEHWKQDGSYLNQSMAAHFKYQRNAASGAIEIKTLSVWLK